MRKKEEKVIINTMKFKGFYICEEMHTCYNSFIEFLFLFFFLLFFLPHDIGCKILVPGKRQNLGLL